MKSLAALAAVLTGSLLAGPAPAVAATPADGAPQAGSSCPALLQYTFPRLQDEKPQALCQYRGRVLLVVNTASYCGYTPQYQGLEDLYSRYRDKGLVVLGFPSNDFNQESGDNKQIADFCENTFGVKFPMFGKTSVAGKDANPLFRQLAAQTGKAPAWNFHKYLIGRDGKVVAQFASRTTPSDPQLLKALEQQLAAH
ncbi:glutathione peroxidase [Ramlibacter alkalitolerans]|uniref:Glutathione peroxidase n=1 Tax=Ramlibacter alkalitolerans TaxID=2039631 RepID=A0ABS1JMP0_9BURK|nr:glutathione peroxidase [Ramlibacter alkalitolerans]MBL0425513.1 glutathione peroxidase [Ramlibacter alkalitolerans]